jgi:hypothetical protein
MSSLWRENALSKEKRRSGRRAHRHVNNTNNKTRQLAQMIRRWVGRVSMLPMMNQEKTLPLDRMIHLEIGESPFIKERM